MDGDTQGGDVAQRGRPTDYKPEFCQKAADLCINGATDFEVAEILGVCVRTLYRWKAQYPEFCQALKVGKAAADDRVEASLFHRAVGYSHPAVKIFMPAGAKEPVFAPYTEHVPPDVGAATLWLTNRRGDEWRSKQSLEGTLTVHKSVDDLTDEQLATIAAGGCSASANPKEGEGSST